MKEQYRDLEVEVIQFITHEIIATSNHNELEPTNG